MRHLRLGRDYLLTYLLIVTINCGAMWALCSFRWSPEMEVLMYALAVTSIIEAIPFTAIMPWRIFKKNKA